MATHKLTSDKDIVSKINRKAFTLIELLVVIAIIALLLSIVMPSLNLVKRKAASAVCLVNAKNISMAWFMYQEANNGNLVSPNTAEDGWVQRPLMEDETTVCDAKWASPETTDEDEKRGIAKGLLFSYLESYDVYHCPADNQRRSMSDGSKIFRTYSMPACLSRGFNKKFTNISTPGTKINLVEEAEGRNYNDGSWDFIAANSPQANTYCSGEAFWQDPIGVNHGDSGILGFCDGHAENHKWKDEDTLERIDLFFNPEKYLGVSINWQGYGFGDNCLSQKFKSMPIYDSSQKTDLTFVNTAWAYKYK